MFVEYMNTKQPNVRFTFEIENRNSFSFLDTKIIRNTEKKLLKDQLIEKVHSVVFLLIAKVLLLWHKKFSCWRMLFRCFSKCCSYKKFYEKIVKAEGNLYAKFVLSKIYR